MGLPTRESFGEAALSIVVFGMGLGESILVRAHDAGVSRWAVIDSARRQQGKQQINPALETLRLCQAHPELVVLTHPHLDHTKGFADIVSRAAPNAVVACVEPLMEPFDELDGLNLEDDQTAVQVGQTVLAHAAIRAAWRRGRARSWPMYHGTERLTLGPWQIEVLHPSREEAQAAADAIEAGASPNLNNVSLALQIKDQRSVVLLGGDGEFAAWEAVKRRLAPEDLWGARPVKAPHHGSRGAIHPVLWELPIGGQRREAVVTPFPNSGRLPRFEPGEGADQLVRAGVALYLTALPLDLVPTGAPVTTAAILAASTGSPFGGDDQDLLVRPQQPVGDAVLASGARDPRECWVQFSLDASGAVGVEHGSHAVALT